MELLSDDDLEQMGSSKVTANGLLSDDDIEKMSGPVKYNGSLTGGFLKSAAQGATAEFGDELAGLVGGDKTAIRQQQDAFETEHPYVSGAGKAAGAIGSTVGLAFVPGGQPAAGARALGWAGRALSGLKSLFGASNAAKAVPGVDAAVQLSPFLSRVPLAQPAANFIAGTNARRGGLAAAQYGATSRAGDYEGADNQPGDGLDDQDTLVNNATGRIDAAFDIPAAAMDYATGTVGTKAFNSLFGKVADATDATRTMAARARGEAGADGGTLDVARRLQQDRVTPQAIRDEVFPDYRGQTQGDVIDIMENYGRLVAGGADDLTARQQVAAQLSAAGANAGTAQRRVNSIVQRYNSRNAVPAQLNELAAMASGGEAANTHSSFVARMNMKADNPVASDVADFMAARQPQIGSQLEQVLERSLGDGDVGRMINEYELRKAGTNDAYEPIMDAFNSDPAAQGALQRAIDGARLEVEAVLGNRADDMAKTVRGQMEKFSNPEVQVLPRGTPDPLQIGPTNETRINDLGQRGTMDLKGFIHQRRALTDVIEASKGEFGKDTATTHDLRDLKSAIDRRVRGIADDDALPPETRTIFTDWASANDQRASLERLRRSFTEGSSLNIKAKGGTTAQKMERSLRGVERMDADNQEMFARGLMSQLKGAMEGKGDFGNVATLFSNRRMRSVLGRVMPEEQVDDFVSLVKRANLATRSQKADKNSPTGLIRDEKEKAALFSRITALIQSLSSPMKMAEGAARIVEDRVFREQNIASLRAMGVNTDNPHELAAMLRNLEASGRYAQPTVGTSELRSAGPFVAITATEQLGDRKQQVAR